MTAAAMSAVTGRPAPRLSRAFPSCRRRRATSEVARWAGPTSVSIEEVARRAGVSIATVSRTFNLPQHVASTTRERVRQIAQQVGYIPNRAASTLRSQRSKVLGVMLPTLLNPVFAECLEGIAVAASAGDYSILPATTDYRIEREERAVDELLARSVDGFILVVSHPARSKALQRINRETRALRAGVQPPPRPSLRWCRWRTGGG